MYLLFFSPMLQKFFSNKPLAAMILSILAITLVLSSMGIYSLLPNKDNEADKGLAFETFDSCNEIERYILDHQQNDYYYPYSGGFVDIAVEEFSDGGIPNPTSSVSRDESSAGKDSIDYSETNIQVQGVDEADIVKTDGEYIYIAWQNEVYILAVISETEQEVISNFEVPGDPFEMFLQDNQLVVLSRDSGYYDSYKYSGYWPLATSENGAFVFDITDRENPELVREVKIEGDFVTARMINDTVYLISSKYFYDFYEGQDIEDYITQLSDSEIDDDYRAAAACDEISHYGSNINSFVNVTAIPLNGEKTENRLILGDASNIYMSKNNVYLSTVAYEYEECQNPEEPRERNILDDLIDPFGGTNDYCYPEVTDVNTDVYKLAVDGSEIDFVASGTVNGTLLNQFSMDEHDGYFRVVTTANDYQGWNRDSYNNLYVLDEKLQEVGHVEGLAEGEQIYSARFMGDTAYMVTFKAIDPLFVIDLSDPKNPEVLGELKIPGYSDYLHPYDENHLIGIGKDAESISDEWALQQGLKIALFDVRDLENPVVKSEVIIGDRGSETAVSYDHKAFLFDRERELLVIPTDINEVKNKVTPEEIIGVIQTVIGESTSLEWESTGKSVKVVMSNLRQEDVPLIEEKLNNYGSGVNVELTSGDTDQTTMQIYLGADPYEYGERVFSGFTVFSINLTEGLVPRGRIGEETSDYGYYYYSSNPRSLYIGENLYTVKDGVIRVNKLETLELVNEIDLYTEEQGEQRGTTPTTIDYWEE